MLVYRCENKDGVGMYRAPTIRYLPELNRGYKCHGLNAIEYYFRCNGIKFDTSKHPVMNRCFDDSVLGTTIYSDDPDVRSSSIFGFANPSQLFNWLYDVNIIYLLQHLFDVKVVVYDAKYCWVCDYQCIFDSRTAKKLNEFYIDEFYFAHDCEIVLNEVDQRVIDLCHL